MNFINTGDFADLYIKLRQRGASYLRSKFSFSARNRTKSTFDVSGITLAHWWIIPQVRARWNFLITGNAETDYETYFVNKYLAGKKDLRMLSIGCGSGSHEFRFATFENFVQIKGIDITSGLIRDASHRAGKMELWHKLVFEIADVYQYDFSKSKYDVILFHSSLHHFKKIDRLLERVKTGLADDGILLVNEYTGANRFQYPEHQMRAINAAIRTIPVSHRKIFNTSIIKNQFHKPGTMRMIVSDPSEAIESSRIPELLHVQFKTLEEKPYGGNLVMPVLKDISHHFLADAASPVGKTAETVLQKLFSLEDEFLKAGNKSDYLFGVYQTI